MTNFRESDDASKFIATASSRETDKSIMKAIVFFARNIGEAEDFWNGDFRGRVDLTAIWENATENGLRDDDDLMWGDRSLRTIMADGE